MYRLGLNVCLPYPSSVIPKTLVLGWSQWPYLGNGNHSGFHFKSWGWRHTMLPGADQHCLLDLTSLYSTRPELKLLTAVKQNQISRRILRFFSLGKASTLDVQPLFLRIQFFFHHCHFWESSHPAQLSTRLHFRQSPLSVLLPPSDVHSGSCTSTVL